MKEFDKTLKYSKFWEQRENVYKPEKMNPIEKKIDKFLAENNIKYHRCFPIRIGVKNSKNKFYGLCSFYLPAQNMILDIPTGIEDENTYGSTMPVFIHYYQGIMVKNIFPIDKDYPWRDVKKQLKILLGI